MIKPKLNDQQLHNRAVNAVLQLMSKRLVVPKIFVEARWPNRTSCVDVLAVDRAGTGDVHVVEVVDSLNPTNLQRMFQLPGHFRYLGVISPLNYRFRTEALFSKDGFGRVGLISFTERGQELFASLDVPAERFRTDSSIYKITDRFTAKHDPAWEIRDFA